MAIEQKLSDSEKLRTLAAWFDLWDAREDKRGLLLTDFGTSDEVQRDLRRIADLLTSHVLVNADMLARAMGDVTGEDEDGSWAWCPERTSQREFAAAILAALTSRASSEGGQE